MSDIIRSEEHNGYTYDVYDSGTTIARGNIQDDKASRNASIQRNAGGDSRQPDDHGGHLVPASQNGTSNEVNISAQNGKVNTRDVRAVERGETQDVRNGAEIQTERIAFCSHDPNRPDAYMINDHETMPDGTTTDIHSSFTNTDMSQYQDDTGLEHAADSYDAAKGSGYSRDEYYGILEEAESMNISDYGPGWTSTSNAQMNEENQAAASLPGNGDIDGVDLSSGNTLDDAYTVDDDMSDGDADVMSDTDDAADTL